MGGKVSQEGQAQVVEGQEGQGTGCCCGDQGAGGRREVVAVLMGGRNSVEGEEEVEEVDGKNKGEMRSAYIHGPPQQCRRRWAVREMRGPAGKDAAVTMENLGPARLPALPAAASFIHSAGKEWKCLL